MSILKKLEDSIREDIIKTKKTHQEVKDRVEALEKIVTEEDNRDDEICQLVLTFLEKEKETLILIEAFLKELEQKYNQ